MVLAELEAHARETGAKRLHLFTTTATSFFLSHGYRDAARGDAPQSVRASNEFNSLCPVNASYMVKSLGSGLIDHSQKITVAAMQMADMKVWAQRS